MPRCAKPFCAMKEGRMVDQLIREQAAPAIADRRRPDRKADVSPHLLPLLRHSAASELARLEAELAQTSQDQLGEAKGLGWGIGFAIPLWAMIIWSVRHFLIG